MSSFYVLSYKKINYKKVYFFQFPIVESKINYFLMQKFIRSKGFQNVFANQEKLNVKISYNFPKVYIEIIGNDPSDFFKKLTMKVNNEIIDDYKNNFDTYFKSCNHYFKLKRDLNVIINDKIQLEQNNQNKKIYDNHKLEIFKSLTDPCFQELEYYGPYIYIKKAITNETDIYKFTEGDEIKISGLSNYQKFFLSLNFALFFNIFIMYILRDKLFNFKKINS